MRPNRKLVLRTETLSDLSAGQLGAIVGAGPTHDGCTLPVNQCALTVGWNCYATDPANCGTGTVVVVKTSATT